MRNLLPAILASLLFILPTISHAQTATGTEPLRVAIAGLAHGHAQGFFERSLHRPDIQIVGIAEADQQVASRYAAQFGLDRAMMFTDLDDMLQKTHPQA
ncbi:MAG: gfo/Idh/MocA family oxidoreductase, partial [Terriglobales bacterium]